MRWAMSSIVLGVLAVPSAALAWLGGDAASIDADRRHMQATVATVPAAGYTRFELQTPSGTRVTEYLSPAGRVFAVAWRGPVLPDLRQALGPYFDRYAAAVPAQGPGTRVVEERGFAAYAGGHMRAFVGRAVIPESVPQGVSIEELR